MEKIPYNQLLGLLQTSREMDPQVQDVYTEFGIAMSVAQSLEQQLVLFIIAGHEPPSGQLTAEAYDDLLAQLSQLTFGALIQKLKHYFDVPANFERRLQEALRVRNWLTHHYFAERTVEFQSPQGRSQMIRELNDLSDRLYELDAYFDRLLVSWLTDPSVRTRKLVENFGEIREEV